MAKKVASDDKKIREISVSEFFSKNRHLLGFDNPLKSLLTTVREAVDNSLDACEESHILPEIIITINETEEDQFLVSIEDNGPGISKGHLPNIFGKLLYGSKFHRLKQSRGQQGIGISAAVMYGYMTTGKPALIISKVLGSKDTQSLSLQMDTKKNEPKILGSQLSKDEYWKQKKSGTKITIELKGAYKEGKHGVLSYVNQTALANPHASITFIDPKEQTHVFPAVVKEPPADPKEIKPHPLGVELGVLIQMLHDAKSRSLTTFLKQEFCRVSEEIAKSICQSAKLKADMAAGKLTRQDAESLYAAIQNTKFMLPPTNCLSPLNEAAIIKSLYWFFVEASRSKNLQKTIELRQAQSVKIVEVKNKKTKKGGQEEFDFSSNNSQEKDEEKFAALEENKEKTILDEEEGYFVTAVTRPPSVYRGNPFQIEVGIFYGKSLPSDESIQVYRYANRVPLQYQASACAMTKAIMTTPWKSYGLSQSKGALPLGPVVIMVCISSVWVPYTSESKEAVAHYPEIIKELKLALMEAGRRLQRFLNKRKKQADEDKKRSFLEKYLSPVQEALSDILGEKQADPKKIEENLRVILEKTRAHKQVKMGKHEV